MTEDSWGKPVTVSLDAVAENVWTKIVTRALMIAGIPMIVFIGSATLGTLDRLSELMTAVQIDLRGHEVRLDAHERQLEAHERILSYRRSFGGLPPGQLP